MRSCRPMVFVGPDHQATGIRIAPGARIRSPRYAISLPAPCIRLAMLWSPIGRDSEEWLDAIFSIFRGELP